MKRSVRLLEIAPSRPVYLRDLEVSNPETKPKMIDSPLPGRAQITLSAEERGRLAKMVMNLFELWNLDNATCAELLGLSRKSHGTLARYRKGAPLPSRRDLLDRVSNLFGIHKSLRMIYAANQELSYRWPTAKNRALGDMTPVEVMVSYGLPAVSAVREYLECLRKS